MFTVKKNPTTKELHRFGAAMLLGFAVLGGVAWCSQWLKTSDRTLLTWTGHWTQAASIGAWILGPALCATAFAPRPIARPVYIAWMTAAVKLGIVMSTIMLTVLFLVLLPLFSLIVRLGDPLRKRLTSGGSYWEDYPKHEPTIERMKRPF